MSDGPRDFHPVANLFPLMGGEDFAALVEDVRSSGLLEPIWLHPDGRVIDGRNRYRACVEAGVEPRFRTWDGSGSLVEFVVSMNLHRRHLTSSQRAMAAVAAEEALAEEANRRRLANLKRGKSRATPDVARMPPRGKSRDRAAEIFGTSPRYVSDAKKIASERPDLAEQVRAGDISLPEAKRQSNPALYTSNSPEWYTPADIIARVETVLEHIDLDPCSNSRDTPHVPADRHYTEADDGLTQRWEGRVYMNPPYGRGIDEWVTKLDNAHRDGRVPQAVALLPARVDTRWFRILRDYTVCFINGRLRFSGADPAPFPSAAFYLGDDDSRFIREFSHIGDLYRRVDAEAAA